MSKEYKTLFFNLLNQILEHNIPMSHLSKNSGISVDRLRKIKKGQGKPRPEDWDKLNSAYGEKKETTNDKIDKLTAKIDLLTNLILGNETKLIDKEENQERVVKLLGKGGLLDQRLEELAKEYGMSVEEVKKMLGEELENGE